MCRLALSIALFLALWPPSDGFRMTKKRGSGNPTTFIEQTSNSTGWGKPPAWSPPNVDNAQWGSDWRLVTNREGPSFQCYGRAAYGRGYNYWNWAYLDMSGTDCCGHYCGFGWDPSRGDHDKQCYCRDLTCIASGEKPKLNNGRFECVGIQRVDVCVKPIFHTDGGSSGFVDEYFEKGTSTSRSMEESTQHRLQVQAKAKYNKVIWSVEMNTQYELDRLTQSSFAETSYELRKTTVRINLHKPAYWYQSQITITLTDWSTIHMKGPWKILSTPLDFKEQICVDYKI